MRSLIPVIALSSGGVCLVVFLLTRFFIQLAEKRQWLVQPKARRWHAQPVVGYGGVCIYLPFALSILFILCFGLSHLEGSLINTPLGISPFALLSASFLLVLSGLADDLFSISPIAKLCLQLMISFFYLSIEGAPPFTPSPSLNVLLTLVWLVGIINSFNLLDNSDGLATSTCFFICIGIVLLSLMAGMTALSVPLFAFILSACMIGFWFYNKPPALVFMGDTGSLPLGFLLGSLTLHTGRHLLFQVETNPSSANQNLLLLLIPLFCLLSPLFDTVFVVLARSWHGQNPLQGGTDHLSHRLMLLGLTEYQMLCAFALLTLFGISISLVLVKIPELIFVSGSGIIALLSLAGFFLFRTTESTLRERPETLSKTTGQAPAEKK